MKRAAFKILSLIIVVLLMGTSVSVVKAAPRLTLTPVSGSYSNGSTFTVTVGVNSDTEKSSAVDVWGTFDAAKLEIQSIVKSSNPPFPFEMTPTIDNTGGKFNFSCASTNMSGYDDAVINGELAVITFKAKAIGTANLNFVCSSGSTTDSNIFTSVNSTYNDVISCSANSSGSYTITDGSSSSTTTSTPTPTTAAGVTATELPKTGAVASTVGLIIFGAISLASALFLKFL